MSGISILYVVKWQFDYEDSTIIYAGFNVKNAQEYAEKRVPRDYINCIIHELHAKLNVGWVENNPSYVWNYNNFNKKWERRTH